MEINTEKEEKKDEPLQKAMNLLRSRSKLSGVLSAIFRKREIKRGGNSEHIRTHIHTPAIIRTDHPKIAPRTAASDWPISLRRMAARYSPYTLTH